MTSHLVYERFSTDKTSVMSKKVSGAESDVSDGTKQKMAFRWINLTRVLCFVDRASRFSSSE